MGKVILDFGTEVDMLNKTELQEALAEDARVRALITGVKQFRLWLNGGTPGMNAASFTMSGTPPQGPAQGFIWMVMNVGAELSASGALRMFLNSGSNAAGGNRLVGATGSGSAFPTISFSKGQCPWFAGDSFTFTTGALINDLFITGIEIPAERIGELLL